MQYTNLKGKSKEGRKTSKNREFFFKPLFSQNDWKIVFCFSSAITGPETVALHSFKSLIFINYYGQLELKPSI
jgi:hypothetical protein